MFTDGAVTPMNQSPLDLKQLKASGFKDTLAMDVSEVAVDEAKAHVVMREGRRIDKNDNPIERVTAFCLLKGAITARYLDLPPRQPATDIQFVE